MSYDLTPPDLARQVVTVSRALAAASRATGASTRAGRLVTSARTRCDAIHSANFALLRAYAECEAGNTPAETVGKAIDTALALLDQNTKGPSNEPHDTDHHAAARTIYGA